MTAAPPVQLACPRCNQVWPMAPEAVAGLAQCPHCGTETRIALFPAFTRPAAQGQSAEAAVLDGEATCFNHPQKRAHVPCDLCGRFLCALCDLELGNQHVCPACFESGAKKGRILEIEQRRTRWDQIVWSAVVAPVVLCWFLLPLSAPVAFGLALWKRKTPASLVDNARLSLHLAMAVAVLEFIGSVVIWGVMLASG